MPSIGPTELVLVFLIALVVLGPKRLPDVGRQIGRALREFRSATSEIRSELGVDEIVDEVNAVRSELGVDELGRDLKKDATEIKRDASEISKSLTSIVDDGRPDPAAPSPPSPPADPDTP